MEDVIINHYHKGKLIDKIFLIIALIFLVMGITLYAMSAIIPSNLMHPNDYYNSINYIDVILITIRIVGCILVMLASILVFIVRIMSLLEKQNKGIDIILAMIGFVFLFALTVLFFWVMNSSWALGYSIVVYYILFPIVLFGFGILISKTKIKLLFTYVLFFSCIVVFHYHLTLGISNLHIQYQYIFFGLLPGLIGIICGLLIRKFIKKINK